MVVVGVGGGGGGEEVRETAMRDLRCLQAYDGDAFVVSFVLGCLGTTMIRDGHALGSTDETKKEFPGEAYSRSCYSQQGFKVF